MEQILVNGLQSSLIYILIALGLCIIFSILSIVNFAHGEFYMLGAFVIYFIVEQLRIPYVVGVVLAFLLVGAFGMFCERMLFRRVVGIGHNALVLSLGLSLVVSNLALHLFGSQDKSVSQVVSGIVRLSIGRGISISVERLTIMACSAFFILLVFLFIHRTKTGRAMRAIAQNRAVAILQGVDVTRDSMIGFSLGCALAGLAGAIVSPAIYLYPSMGLPPAIKAFVVIVLGGMGSIHGAVLGGLILGFLEATTQFYTQAVWADFLGFVVLISVLIVKPSGILGHRF
jgi:branched-chain amino acid transport system permease protein